MANYEETEGCVFRTDADGKTWAIPKIESNSDYQRYLRWLENPNAPEFTDTLS